jgi:hypothetical protein
MTRCKRFLWILAALCLGALGDGCGTTGSRPTLYPEVRFEVDPVPASVTFRVDALVAGGVQHTFPADMVFTASGPFFFYFENAPPPYSGTFTVCGKPNGNCSPAGASDGNLHVKLFVPGTTEVHEFNAETLVPHIPQVTISSGPISAVTPPTREVRFDLCVPFLTPGTCFTGGDSGLFSKSFTGTLGDASQTHELFGATPSIYFLEGAQDNVDGVFTLDQTGPLFVAQLFIDGILRQTQANTGDVIVTQDL